MTGLAAVAFLLAAGTLAATVGTAGGIASLVSYPALLLAGLDPLSADVVNILALLACWPGSVLSSRRELVEVRASLRLGVPIAATGAVVGAILLLTTSVTAFSHIVPFLVLAGGAALLLQPHLTAHGAAPRRGRHLATWPLIALVSIYSGYFGAGAGVLLLAVILGFIDGRLPEANALKNSLVGATSLASTGVLITSGPVVWSATVPLAFGAFLGSLVGPRITRRVPAIALRWTVAALSVVLAVQLWLSAA